MQKSYTSVANPDFNSFETQTMLTWIEGVENPTRLSVNQKGEIITPSYKTSNSSLTATNLNTFNVQFRPSVQLSKKSRQLTSKSQHTRSHPQGYGKMKKKTLDTLTSEQDIANKLGQSFKKKSSTENYHQ